MAGRLYKRIASLILARPVKGSFTRTQPNAIEITDLRIAFRVTKTSTEEPNTAEIEVYNLAETTRAELQKKPLHVLLQAGYDGEMQRLFQGDLRWAESLPLGPDWMSRLRLGDGERAFRFARISKSFKGGVDKRQVLDEVAQSMGLKLPKNMDDVKELGKQFVSGITLSGPSREEMDRIAKSAGLEWSIQDGRLQMLRVEDVEPGTAYVVAEETGMIGSPEYGAPPEEGKPPVLNVASLLYPQIGPGRRIRVESRTIRGFFKVIRVTHAGDTHGHDWLTHIQAVPL